jgi:hypothetical protein
MKSFPHPTTKEDVIAILGDQSDKEYSIFQESGDDVCVKTVDVGKMTIQLTAFVTVPFHIYISTVRSILAQLPVLPLQFC